MVSNVKFSGYFSSAKCDLALRTFKEEHTFYMHVLSAIMSSLFRD